MNTSIEDCVSFVLRRNKQLLFHHLIHTFYNLCICWRIQIEITWHTNAMSSWKNSLQKFLFEFFLLLFCFVWFSFIIRLFRPTWNEGMNEWMNLGWIYQRIINIIFILDHYCIPFNSILLRFYFQLLRIAMAI